MENRSIIICSESNVDLKDKVVMGEQLPNVIQIFPSLDSEVTGEVTLADIIKNSQKYGHCASITGVASISPIGLPADSFAIRPSQNLCYMSEVLGQEWVVPNIKISDEIKNRNPNGYIYIESQSGDAKAILVLCEEVKQLFEDGSYKIVYNPVTHRNVKRMSE